jgi:TP901 family phage tail tape measure protein
MTTLAKLVVELVGDVKDFMSGMDAADAKWASVGGNMTKAGGAMTAGVTVPLLGLGALAFKTGSDFDSAMDTIRTTTGATGETLTGLGEDARAVFSEIPTDMATAGEAIGDLYSRTGQTGEGLQDLAATEIELARITGGDLGSQIQNTTRLFGDWGVAAQNQVPALDALLRTSQATGIGVDTLAAKMVQFGAPLRQMGFDFNTSAALIGKFEKEGVNSELVLGSLRIALGKMAKDGIAPVEGLKQLVASIQSAGSTADANKLAIDAFGARAGPDMAAAIREGRFGVDDLVATIASGSETVLGAAEDTNDYAEKLTVLKNQALNAAIPLGTTLFGALDKLMPTFEKVIGFVAGLIEKFSNMPEGAQTAILTLLAIAAAIGPILSVVGPLIGALGGVAGAGGLGAIVAAAAPVIAVIAAIVAAVIALKWAWDNNFLGIRDTIQAVFEQIKAIVGPIIDWLGGKITFEEMAAKVGPAFERLNEIIFGVFMRIGEKVGEVLNALKDLIVQKLLEFIAPLVGGMDNARTLVANAWENITNVVSAAWEFLKGIVAGGVEALRGIIAGLIAFLAGDPSKAWEAIRTAAVNAWDALKTGVGNALDALHIDIGAKLETIKGGLAEKWESIRAGAAEKWTAVQTTISGVVTGIYNTVVTTIGNIVTAAAGLFQRVIEAVSGGGTGEAGQGQASPMAGLLDIPALTGLVMQAVGLIRTLREQTTAEVVLMPPAFAAVWTEIQTTSATAWEALRSSVAGSAAQMRDDASGLVAGMRDEISSILDGMVSDGASSGSAFGNAVADGIYDSIGAAVAAAEALAAAVDAVLPHSDAERGPLSHLTESGRSLPETLAAGVLSGAGAFTGAVERTLGGLSLGTANGDAGADGRSGQTINVTINNPVGEPAESSMARELRKLAWVGVLG